MVLEGLNGACGSPDAVVVWFNQLEADFGILEASLDGFRCHIVHDIEFWIELSSS